MLKRILVLICFGIVALASVMVVRSFLIRPNPVSNDVQIVSSETFNIDIGQAVQHLSKAVSFKTISTEDNNATNAASFEEFHAFLQNTYPNVFEKLTLKKMGAYGLLFAWKGQDETIKPILLMAHQDVVPIAKNTDHLWEHEPFSGDIDDKYVWGRGSLDDKASLIAIFETVEQLLKENVTPRRSIYLYFGDNEEIGGATAVETAKYLKDQGVQFEFLVDEGGWVSDDNKAYISIVEKGYIDVKLSTKAKGGHSSMPPKITAIGRLSTAISKLENNKFPKRFVGANQLTLDALMPELSFSEKLIATNMWFFGPFLSHTPLKIYFSDSKLQTTTAPTIFQAGVKSNVLPAEANATINFRILPGETTETVIDRVKKVIDDEKITITSDKAWNPSVTSSTDTEGYKLIKAIIHKVISPDVVVIPNLLSGATDAGRMASVSDYQYRFLCGVFNKLDFAGYHGTNERFSKENVERLMRFYDLLIQS